MSNTSNLLGPRASRPPSWNATLFQVNNWAEAGVNPLLEAGGTPAVPVVSLSDNSGVDLRPATGIFQKRKGREEDQASSRPNFFAISFFPT